MKPEQLKMFDLPDVEDRVIDVPAEKQPAPKRAGQRNRQPSLAVRQYEVKSGGDCFRVQAASPSAAKYIAFRFARSMGQYLYEGGFMAFVSGGLQVREERRSK
ncbi:hypothetical protein HAP48_0043135 [Bradyrhizobium septentrionale]|uniref:Uncharacterized protein n=1 Tax=Bradyrhizobium septentrionale TaxID=1404411 RepID=A0A973W3L8_9BRAD|nr:hypothetical protein [Bradyrhizobium septentrionale]UGY15254.1 hypothetical protein HAP48_0043135 [Bradyrhizobium septentrionale]UGY23841.1 hypothetical protein HU675_0038820 [Bradyrhizobium septentrionale]